MMPPVAEGEREQQKKLMDNLERRVHANHIVFWLRENYMVGTSGSLSKRSVYSHYLSVTKQVTKKPLISPTFFGKLVKRAFPTLKCNRKGPRGQTKQHYTHLQRVSSSVEDERAFPTADMGLLPTSPYDNFSDCGSRSSPAMSPGDSKFFISPVVSFEQGQFAPFLMQNQSYTLASPSSPGGTTSPDYTTATSSPQQQASSPTSSGWLCCDQCQMPAAHHHHHHTDTTSQPFIKQEEAWFPEISADPLSSAYPSYAYSAGSYLDHHLIGQYTQSCVDSGNYYYCGTAVGASPTPSVEITLPLDENWTSFLLDN